jgi:putative heme-binding domain-containing protein
MNSLSKSLLLCTLILFSHAAGNEWETLFNGKDLEGWTERNKSGSFMVKEGAIIGTAMAGLGTTFLCTDRIFRDFELMFECQIDEGLNSGVQIRSNTRKPRGKQKVGPVEGPQVDLACKAKGTTVSGNVFGQSWGEWLTPKDGRRKHALMKADSWNDVRILAQGDQITTWINGEKVITTTIPDARHQTNSEGFIGLQLHGIKEGQGPFTALWKNIRIRTIGGALSPQKKMPEPAKTLELQHAGPKPPFRQLPVFQDHDLSFFAMAPEINCPVSVICEPSGAVFALCDGNAGLGRDPDQGKVWRLIDHDDDGKADTATEFIANIDTPRGGQFLNGTLYLVHPPFVSTFRDTDGDGVADGHQVLARGFAHDLTWKRGGDHSTNDLKIGLDGWIYLAVGDFGANAIGSDGSKATLMTGGVIRMRMDGSDLEVYARGTRNTYDLAINPRLDLLAMDNTNDGDGWDMRLHHLTPLAHMGYPNLFKNFSDDAMPPLFVYGGGSGCGALYLEEPGFPDWFNNRFQTISWGRLYTHDLTSHEATFTNRDRVSLQLNKLVDLDVDGSSRLYFTSFEGGGARIEPGAIVGHLVQAKPKGWKKRTFPDLDKATNEELITHLDQKSGVLRLQAQGVLCQRENPEIDDLLFRLCQKKTASLEARIAALFAINLRNGEGSALKIKTLLSVSELTEFALRALVDRPDQDHANLATCLASHLNHKNPRVRLQAIYGAKKLQLNQLTKQLLVLSIDTERKALLRNVPHEHRAIPHTAQRALISLAPLQELHALLDDPNLRSPALKILRQIHTTENVHQLIAKLKRSKDLEILAALVRLYHREKKWDGNSWWGTRPHSAGPYYQGVTWEESETIATALRPVVAAMSEGEQKKVLFLIRRHNLDLDDLKLPINVDPLEQLLGQDSHPFSQQKQLLKVVTNSSHPAEMRRKAFHAALDVSNPTYGPWLENTLRALAEIHQETSLYEPFAKAFLESPAHRTTAMQRVTKSYSRIKKLPVAQQSLYFDMLCLLVESPLTHPDERKRMIAGAGKQNFPPAMIESIKRHRATAFVPLLQKASENPKTAELAKETLKELANLSKQRVGDLSPVDLRKALLQTTGDSREGRKLFTRQSCIACHSVNPAEVQKGPYLGSVGNLFTRDQLITHIIDPAAEVAQGFQTHTLTRKDGTTLAGFTTKRTEQTLTIRDITGRSQVIPISEIASEKMTEGSMMPPGLVDTLSIKEFASLLDYLQSLH